jgi:hypothetical protein
MAGERPIAPIVVGPCALIGRGGVGAGPGSGRMRGGHPLVEGLGERLLAMASLRVPWHLWTQGIRPDGWLLTLTEFEV